MEANFSIRCKDASPYSVYVQDSLRPWEDGRLSEIGKHSQYFLFTQANLPRKLIDSFLDANKKYFPYGRKDPHVFWMKDGEKSKNISQLKATYEKLLKLGVDRKACIFALGGGVVGDFTGFVAATILRGIDFIQVPTTLLAAVDASIGGKVAINIKYGKNMVGSFHYPKCVYINLDFLNSLSQREWICGCAEMLKHGLIEKTGQVLENLFSSASSMSDPNSPKFKKALIQSLRVKAKIVEEDEKEHGLRMALNLGHTTAHGLESLSRYRRFSHGEAVSRGLVTALLLSRNILGLSASFVAEFLERMEIFELPRDSAGYKAEAVYKHMCYDKKGIQGSPRFVLLKRIGEALWDQEISCHEFKKAWDEQIQCFG